MIDIQQYVELKTAYIKYGIRATITSMFFVGNPTEQWDMLEVYILFTGGYFHAERKSPGKNDQSKKSAAR